MNENLSKSVEVSTPNNQENFVFVIYCIFLPKEEYHFRNDHYYIGQHYTNNINDKYMGSGVILKKLYKKYGKQYAKKTILAFVKTIEECNELEKKYIQEYRDKYGQAVLNIQDGGRNNTCFNISEKAHLRNIEGLRNYYKNPKNKKALELRAKHISESMMGNINGKDKHHLHSDETKKLISKRVKESNKIRIPKLSEAGKKMLYVYKDGLLKEYKSVKYSWKELGFTSEAVCQRFVRYCTKLLDDNKLQNFNFKYGNIYIAYHSFDVNIIQELFNGHN